MHKYLLNFFVLLITFQASATSWTTINYGYWSDGAIWAGGVVPPHTSADTFFIEHPIVIDNTVVLQPGAYVLIDTTGGICGHELLSVQTNALLHNYGILELDSLFVPGGSVYNFYTGKIILTWQGQVSNGGYMWSNGAMAVGPWFQCHQPEYGFLTGISESENSQYLKLYPNPASNELFIVSECKIGYILVRDLNGRMVKFIQGQEKNLPLSTVSPGIYAFEFYDEQDLIIAVKKVVVQR